MLDLLMIIGGLVLLFYGGEGLVTGAVSLARQLGVSKVLVSAVIVGFGTSMPELTVSVSAALRDAAALSVGNVIGSNIANVLLVVGVAALLAPITVAVADVRRDTWVMLLATAILCVLCVVGVIEFYAGALMFALLVGYIVWGYTHERASSAEEATHVQADIEGDELLSLPMALLYSLGGLVLVIGGAWILVEGAVSLAQSFGVSEAVIGLSIVAVGTSLPELATAVAASRQRHGDVIIGNILGSNIFNILSILGITAMITALPIDPQLAAYDVWIMSAITLVLAGLLLASQTLARLVGAAMLLAYAGYIYWLYLLTLA